MRSLAVPFLLAATLPAAATELSFEITGAEAEAGHVIVALYDEASFLRKPIKAFKLKPGKALAGTFGDVPPGLYAVSVVHDENDNGRLDFNAVGMPMEKYGFSNNPVLMGPPRFDDARIEVNGTAKSVPVALR
jgi:uncharacterized protein (DUF2141 family)